MALTLAADIDAEQTAVTFSGTLPAALAYGYEFRIGDELLVFERFEPKRLRVAGTWVDIPFAKVPSQLAWQVRRGEGGSTAASHSSGASLVGVNEASVSGGTTAKPIPWPSGGGGGAVDSVNTQTGVVVLDAGDLATAVGPGPTVEDTLAALAGASSPLLSVTRTLTSAELLSLFTTPITLVAGVADKAIFPLAVWFHFMRGAVDYVSPGGFLVIGSANTVLMQTQLDNAVLDFSEDTNTPVGMGFSLSTQPVSAWPVAGAPLTIADDTGNPTLGDGTLAVTTIYALVPA